MFSKEELQSMKYAELQKLAKSAGIRANQKVDRLIKALTEHYECNESLMEGGAADQVTDVSITAITVDGLRDTTNSSLITGGTPMEGVKTDNKSRKRKRTFELEEATLKGDSTPVIENNLPQITRLQTSLSTTPQSKYFERKSVKKLSQSTCDKKSPMLTDCTPKEPAKADCKNRKRRRTFELEEATIKGNNTPVIENDQSRVTRLRTSRNTTPQSESSNGKPVKRLRSSTNDNQSSMVQDKDSDNGGSPSTRAIIDSINGDCSSAERKEQLLSAIGKKVQMKMVSSPANPGKSQTSQIPRFMAFLTNKKKDQQNSGTPGNKAWDKIHKKEFAKFDSIDVYLDKKQQRKENLSTSTKKLLMANKKSPAVKPSSRPSQKPFKDQVASKLFKPTVMSTKNINFNFSHAMDASKTPKSKAVNTPSRKQAPTSTKLASIKKATHTTPFKFTGNTSTLNTTVTLNTSVASSKKNRFDLKASLAKPLSWKPHTGKLHPVDTNTKQSGSVSRSANISSQNRSRIVLGRDASSRMRPVQAKNVRRAAQLDRRSNQKYMDMMKRRGLLA